MTLRRSILSLFGAVALLLGGALPAPSGAAAARLPNVIFILADDLGYGDLGVYGQRLIRTPNLDRMAAEGMRFTQFYAGATVCAPSRAVLMTGRHMGHVRVRGNAGRVNPSIQFLPRDERTVAEVFQKAGYRTALFGKWGLGEVGSDGHPNRKGFDEFFGFLNQSHAHNYYPSFLFHNNARFPLRNVPEDEDAEIGSGYAKVKVEYAPDVIFGRAMTWVEEQRDKPFFLYLASTLPHANNEAARARGDGQETPDYGIYKDRPWPDPDKGQAAMITRLDAQVGALFAKLKALGLDRDTLVIFTSDNGPHAEGRNNQALFTPAGPLRGMKRALYEGGVRVPFIVRWPGKVRAGAVSDHMGYFGDWMATVGELTNQALPAGLDSISFLPALTGRAAKQRQHKYLYFEFYEQGGRQSVRFGKWKAIREPMRTGRVQLYDLSTDLGEKTDVADANPAIVRQAAAYMDEAHVDDPAWPVPGAAGRTNQ
ncbi:MAG: arylsulfatase [Blastocatellia bacterium]|nr:arylsulfatase [Blastocatellia bacterium]